MFGQDIHNLKLHAVYNTSGGICTSRTQCRVIDKQSKSHRLHQIPVISSYMNYKVTKLCDMIWEK